MGGLRRGVWLWSEDVDTSPAAARSRPSSHIPAPQARPSSPCNTPFGILDSGMVVSALRRFSWLAVLALLVAACGGSSDEEPDTSAAAAPAVTTSEAAATTTTMATTTTEPDFVASLTVDQMERLRLMCDPDAGRDVQFAVLTILSGEVPVPPAMAEAIEQAEPQDNDSFNEAVGPECAKLVFPAVEASAEPEPETPGGLLIMEFSDRVLEYEIDECPLETLASGGSWSSGNRQIVTNTVDGSDWQIDVYVDHGSETYSAGAIGPDGSPYFSAFTGAGQVAAVYETEVSDSAAVYSSTFRDNISQGQPDTAFTMTITCDN